MMMQLVLQFKTTDDLDSFNKLITFEESLDSLVADIAKVDGHDIGSGEMNIFILTDQPVATFKLVRQTMQSTWPSKDMKAAYRPRDSEEYVCLWPTELSHFQVS